MRIIREAAQFAVDVTLLLGGMAADIAWRARQCYARPAAEGPAAAEPAPYRTPRLAVTPRPQVGAPLRRLA